MSDVDKSKFQALIDEARAASSPHVDLGPIGIPIKVGVDDLQDVVLAHDHLPTISVEFDGGAQLVVKHIDGGVMATLTGTF